MVFCNYPQNREVGTFSTVMDNLYGVQDSHVIMNLGFPT